MTDHSEALEEYQCDYDAERTNIDDAYEDNRFCASDQWPEDVRKVRESEGRPTFTINRTGQFVRQISGEWRKVAPTVEAIPGDEEASSETADILDGIIRQTEYKCGAANVYSWGVECAARCGIGHWRIGSRYEGETFDQEIYVERILDPLSVVWDGNASDLVRKDAKRCWVTELITEREFKLRFKDKVHTSFPQTNSLGGNSLYWRSGDMVRIASLYRIVPVKKKIGLTREGRIIPLDGISREWAQLMGVIRDREVEIPTVTHQIMSGDDMLSDVQKCPGRYIPIVPVIGEEIPLDGKIIRHGIVRWMKDPQRLYNIWRSASAEMIALSPKAPFVGPLDAFAGLERFWNRANTANVPFLPFNPVASVPNGGKPERQSPPSPPTAMWEEANISQDDMKATTGMYDAALGAKSNETSGKAIEARQRETDTGTFVYFDNANASIQRTGEIYVDYIQNIYDGERTIRVLSKEGEERAVPINKGMRDAYGPGIVNDLSAGRYNVRIKTGPNYATAREQAREQLGAMIQGNPELMGVIGDLYVESLDIPNGDKIVERLRRTIRPEILGEEGGQPQGPDPMQQAGMEAQLAELQAKINKMRAETFDKQQSGISKQIDNAAKSASLQQFGPEPPSHIQKAEERIFQSREAQAGRDAQQQEARESRFHTASEAERGRQFSRQERQETAQERLAQ